MKFKEFLKKALKPLIVLVSSLVLIFVMMGIADQIQKDFGNVVVEMGSFEIDAEINGHGLDDSTVYETEDGTYAYEAAKDVTITYKLYKPANVSSTNKAPAALLLHGYQNDHETCDAYAIELSRRGYVVLAIDEYGHGKTNTGIRDRGYVCQKVSFCFGYQYDGKDGTTPTEVSASSADRYKVMMNFSNLTFFNELYTIDEENNCKLNDSSMGGIAAYGWLASQDYVERSQMVISGHSMGTWASWSVAAAYTGATLDGESIEPRATVLQCGEVFSDDAYDTTKFKFNNVLILQAKWDEFNYFRDYSSKTVTEEEMLAVGSPRYYFLKGSGTDEEDLEFDTTYGSFTDGSARMVRFLYTNHRLTTHDENGLKTAIEWMDSSVNRTPSTITNFTYHAKEWLTFFSLLVGIVSMIALFNVLIKIPFFGKALEPVVRVENGMSLAYRPEKLKSDKKWWKGAIITVLISACTYPFMTQLGHGLMPLPEYSIFRMTIGNGFLCWYLLLIIIMLLTTIIPFKKSQKTENKLDFVDLGLSRESHKNKFDWALLGKMALITFFMVLLMYIEVVLCEEFFMLDFRMIWPFFKSFDWTRFGQFLVYFPIFAVFFVLNNSKIFAQGRCKEMDKPGFKGFMGAWAKSALCMVGGILIIILIEYIPFFLGYGPGMDLLVGTTFGGPFMSLLIVFAPQVVIFSLIDTYMYRKTGNVYVGALTVAALACWIVTGGSAIF